VKEGRAVSTSNVYTPGVNVVVDTVIEYSFAIEVTLVPAADGVTARTGSTGGGWR
jgi:hypothetical protein